jgi:gamma-glutamylcyclotransferase (GGCT)/AIG2-like uncharacterized protein YtfP
MSTSSTPSSVHDASGPVRLTYLFVYGTLMPRYHFYRCIQRFVSDVVDGWIRGRLVDLGNYPALLEGDGLVLGKILELDPAALTVTDDIEDCRPDESHSLYLRRRVNAWVGHPGDDCPDETTHGPGREVWAYFFARTPRHRGLTECIRSSRGSQTVYAWPAFSGESARS